MISARRTYYSKCLVHTFVISRLDHCNSLLFGLPKYLFQRLQRVQKCAARLVLCGRKFDPITPLLKELHWLPIEQRIIFKILFLTFKARNNLAPDYVCRDGTRIFQSGSWNLHVWPNWGPKHFLGVPKSPILFYFLDNSLLRQ